jgi:uncharacterized membrane protein
MRREISPQTGSMPAVEENVKAIKAWDEALLLRRSRVEPFDPFPFQLLTMLVSLEAIFLALFVLASQNRLAKQSDLRANLDLQIDLLSEREMTAVLQLLQDIARAMDVKTSVTPDQISDLVKKTDVKALARQVDPP